jgi:flagellar biosynthetic protein FliQ
VAAFAGLLHEALLVAALLSLPVLCIATLAGTAIAVLQAATQVQEQTLALLPKLLAVAVLISLFGEFGMHVCAGLFSDALRSIPALVGE